MFDLVSSWLLAIWPYAPETQPLATANLSAWVQQTTAADLIAPRYVPDRTTISALNAHIRALESQGLLIDRQGVWFQSGRNVLAQHEGTTPFPAASLTKIATTLAALDTWGIDHQFETIVYYRGTVEDGVLQGDLLVQGGGDPFFVWEEAIALGNALNQAGIQTVTGDLIITGAFAMNFEDAPQVSAALLRRGLNASLWPDEAQQQFATMPPNTPRPSVTIQGNTRVVPASASLAYMGDEAMTTPLSRPPIDEVAAVNIILDRVLNTGGILVDGGADGIAVQGTPSSSSPSSSLSASLPVGTDDFLPLIHHRSVPMIELLKQLNIYSNNFMADALAEHLGGADIVAQHVTQLTGIPRSEIQLINGSGLGVENQISARAVCAMLIALDGRLSQSGYAVADVLPVAGMDEGTIQNRDLPLNAAVKTGTLATVSTLAGSIPSNDGGVVWFAILNWGSDLDGLRNEQDRLLKAVTNPAATSSLASNPSDRFLSSGDGLLDEGGRTIAPAERQNPDDRKRNIGHGIELGAPERNEILAQF